MYLNSDSRAIKTWKKERTNVSLSVKSSRPVLKLFGQVKQVCQHIFSSAFQDIDLFAADEVTIPNTKTNECNKHMLKIPIRAWTDNILNTGMVLAFPADVEPFCKDSLPFSHKSMSEVQYWCWLIMSGSEWVVQFIPKVSDVLRSGLCAVRASTPDWENLHWVIVMFEEERDKHKVAINSGKAHWLAFYEKWYGTMKNSLSLQNSSSIPKLNSDIPLTISIWH